ncbi:MAG: hypothetical protein KGI27_11340 [Thaumarchaeota archaeon]|nr:hypothetical protein [Nitrososphaerota archaeon]
MTKKTTAVQLPKDLVEDLIEASLRFQEVVETLEVQLDKKTVERLKRGEKEYRQGRYNTAANRDEIEKVLS